MKKRYLSIIVIGAALFTWNCGDNTSKAESLPSTADFPYYYGSYSIDPSTGAVIDINNGVVVGQLNADGSVTDANGITLFNADTTKLPTFTTGGFLVNKNGVVTDLNGEIIGTLNEDNSITKKDGSIIDLEGNLIKEADLISSSETAEEPVSSSSIVADPEATLLNTVAVGSIYSDLTVRDANGKIIGTFDANTGRITLVNGTVVTPEGTVISSPKSSTSTSNSSNSVSNSSNSQQTQSSASQQNTGSITVMGSLNQTVQKNTAIATVTLSGVSAEPTRSWKLYWLNTKYENGSLIISGTVPEFFQEGTSEEKFIFNEGTITLTINVGQASQVTSSSSQQQTQISSSSVAKSSSSSVKSSSSVAVSSSSKTNTSGNTNLVYINGGASGKGWATRYWDCCKPSCSWKENAGGNVATQCNATGTTKLSDLNATSVCVGGTAATCKSQIPIVVNDNLAYALAAVSTSDGGQCGHCYALEFTGEGEYENKAPQQGLKGKILVVMASNVGSDVSQGQFDVMIPGGGVGIYNGCANMGWGDMGNQYGGLLAKCEEEVGYSKNGSALTNARKECLTTKCNSTFKNDPVAKEGCLFLATWMNAAGNPKHTYKEVECPAALKEIY